MLTLAVLLSITPAAPVLADPHAWRDPELLERLQELRRIAQEKRELAIRFEHGEGLPRDAAMAAQLYCESAREGDVEAQFRLGWMYANGRGVSRDDGIASSFFRLAADQGHPQAQSMGEVVRGNPEIVANMPACMNPPQLIQADQTPASRPSAAPLNRSASGLHQLWSSRADQFVAQLGLSPGRQKIVQLVQQLAPRYQLDPRLVLALIQAESGFSVDARSPKNAMGLMQLIPATAERFGISNPTDPVQNLRGGMAYLRWLLSYFRGNVALVLAGYNAGEGAVDRYRGVPPYAETLAYVQRIRAAYPIPNHPYDTTASQSVSPVALRELSSRSRNP